MNGHIHALIEIYLDGEMTPQQKQQVETHLAQCADCSCRVAEQRSLSNLLREVPPAVPLKPEKQFVAEVGLLLNRQQIAARPYQRFLNLTWQMIPLGLILAYGFVQTVFILSNLLGFIPGATDSLTGQSSLLPAWLLMPHSMSSLSIVFGHFNLLDWDWLTGLMALVGISLLYVCWLITWWIHTQPKMEKLTN
jgi:hypothetical protein